MRQILKRTTIRKSFSTSIIIEYQDLKNEKNLDDVIEKAYGPKGTAFNNIKEWEFYLSMAFQIFLKCELKHFHCFRNLLTFHSLLLKNIRDHKSFIV